MPFLSFFRSKAPPRVVLLAVTQSKPFVFGQLKIIVRVDDGVFALGERYAAEGIAVTNAAIEKHWQDGYTLKPVRNFDFENVLDDFSPPADEIRSTKSEIRNKFE